MTRLVVPVLFLLPVIAGAEPPATHQVKLDGQTFTLPVGFTIEKVAGPPLVDRPIVATFDDRGRLYVADSSGSNEKPVEQRKHPNHRIIRLEDTKGTGVFDKATVFADKMMFPEGILWHRGSVYVGAPPHIWKLTDTDDDGVADKREIWFDGKTVTGCANDLHGPYLGPDGWIYWCKGAFAKQEYTLPNGKKFTTRASHIFRARPDGTGIEPVMTGGMDNPVGLAFLPNGERFFTCTFVQHPAAGKRDGIIHAVYGGIWGKDHDVIYDPDHKWTSPNLMPVMTHLGPAAPCGLCCYQSDAFGKEFTTNLFACQFNLRKVSRHVLKPSGSTYTTEDHDFVVSDSTDFHPTDVHEDADGSLLIVNTGGWYKLCCPSSQLVKADVLGAIYRVRKEGAKRFADPYGKAIGWGGSADRTFSHIRDNCFWVRRTATERVIDYGESSIISLWNLVAASTRYPGQVEGVTALGHINHPKAREGIRMALQSPFPEVAAAAARMVGLNRDREAVGGLLALLQNDSPYVRRAAIESLGRLGDRVAAPVLFTMLDKADDWAMKHAIIYALIEIGDQESAVRANQHMAARRANFMVLDQIGYRVQCHTAMAIFVDDDPDYRMLSIWLFRRHPEWGTELVDKVLHVMRTHRLSSQEHDEFIRLLARAAKEPDSQALFTARLKEPKYKLERRYVLQAMAKSGLKELPESWANAFLELMVEDDEQQFVDIIQVLRNVQTKKTSADALAKALEPRLGSHQDLQTRTATVAALVSLGRGLDATAFTTLVDGIQTGHTAQVSGVAAEVLSKAKLTSDQFDALIAALPKVSPLELDRVLTAFAQTKDDAIGLKLVAALNNPALRSSLRADQVKERIKHFGPAVQKEAEKLYAALNAEYEQQRARLDEVAKNLKPGDVRRGQAVFNSTKTSCIACHTIGYVGGKIGPDLTRIGAIRQERDLLESILFPSASFVRSYEPLTVRTKDGKVFNGIPKKDAPDEIVLILAADKEQRIAREDIEEVQPGKVSIMPAGLDKQLSEQELADLIAFLKACK